MKTPSASTAGNALLLALGTIVILSAVGANVLGNLTTRYNVSNNQVRGWKQAQHAAETAGDIAYAEVRKLVLDPTNAFPVAAGWTKSGDTWTSPATTFGPDNLVASSTVYKFHPDAETGSPWYRIRATGTAPLRGLKRVGMDDRMGPNTRGDSLLRKIDFTYDHFIAAYGPNGDGVGKAIVPVANPQLSRRVELIAAPVTPFDAAIKAQGTFYGLGNAARIDSYDSRKPPYIYQFAADNPSHPRYADSRSGHVQIGKGVAEVRGQLYGNLSTNGGRVLRSSYVSGTVDNNVPFSLPPYYMPAMPPPELSPTSVNGVKEIRPDATGSSSVPIYYLLSEYGVDAKVTIAPKLDAMGNPLQTYVALKVTNDFLGAITVKPNVRVQVYFERSMIVKQAGNIVNESGIAANLQFYGISPPPGSSIVQTIEIPPPGNFACTIYAPSANYKMNGNPDITGALVCNSFYGNGNTMWHYDRALDYLGNPVDYRVASYVEDIR